MEVYHIKERKLNNILKMGIKQKIWFKKINKNNGKLIGKQLNTLKTKEKMCWNKLLILRKENKLNYLLNKQ